MTTLFELIDAVARVMVFGLLNSLWTGIGVAALVWCVLRWGPRTSASTRYVVWFVSMLGVLALPVLAGALSGGGQAHVPGRISLSVPEVWEAAPGDKGIGGGEIAVAPSAVEYFPEREAHIVETWRNTGLVPEGAPGWWPLLIFGLWLTFALAKAGCLVRSFCHLRRLKRTCKPLPAACQARLKAHLDLSRHRRWVRLCSSPEVASPVAVGLLNPMIIVPEGLADRVTRPEFSQIVLHELAHIQRWDDWTGLGQEVIEALLFFHPAVVWAGRRLKLEREIACDDRVILATGEPRRYAACLTRLLELAVLPAPTVPASGAVKGPKQMFRRLEVLLDGKCRAARRFSWGGLLTAVCLVAAVVVACSRVSPVIEVDGRREAQGKFAHLKEALLAVLIGNPLPASGGRRHQVIVAADAPDLQALKGTFRDLFGGMMHTPREERLFVVGYAEAADSAAFRYYRNLVIAAPLGVPGAAGDLARSLLTESDLARRHRTGVSSFVKRDVWAQGQVVVVVVGRDRHELRDRVAMEGDRILRAVESHQQEYAARLLYYEGEHKALTEDLARRFGWRVRVPRRFRLMEEHTDSNLAVLARQIAGPGVSMWLSVYWERAVPPGQLTGDWCIEKRDEIARRFFGGDEIVQREVTVQQREFAGRLAVYLEGPWRNNRLWKGGAFRSYVLVDAEHDRLYFVDMSVFAPNRNKAVYLQQLEHLAGTFETDPFYEWEVSAAE